MDRQGRETAVLQHLRDGCKPEIDFDQGARESARRLHRPMKTKSVGGRAALNRCRIQGWVSFCEDDEHKPRAEYRYRLTEQGTAELNNREGKS